MRVLFYRLSLPPRYQGEPRLTCYSQSSSPRPAAHSHKRAASYRPLDICFSPATFVCGPAFTDSMDTLSGPFIIEINGMPITKVGSNAEDRTQATTGPDAATFTLKSGKLQSGDWVLARATREDRSFLPKPVRWFKIGAEGDKLPVHPVTAHEEGSSYKIKFANACLIAEDGNVLADLAGRKERCTTLISRY
ncbi:hypothetical protein P171DRAFT_520969 [Karstenula rhodostoma CBS 690.94]|uniref:Uncharacterized protein n=1 Tax=Karstenula rhodostoma CBS 690.94 TaxID=1392251 RepID=A0A9P4UC55_9PLEO|nr:hypothetical protein P171DRAFT_520969 [Karstenula rhodostoma CBS 690.94]